MQTNTDFTTTLIKEHASHYILKAGSYITLQGTVTANGLRKICEHRKEGEGKLVWGRDVDRQTGRVKRDIHFTTRTQVANYVFGANQLTLSKTKKNGPNLPKVTVNYINFDEVDFPKKTSSSSSKNKTKQVNKYKFVGESILDDLKSEDELTTKKGISHKIKGELLLYWVSKKGYNYPTAKEIQIKHNLDNNLWHGAIQDNFKHNYLTREGVDESKGPNKYKNWTIELTEKGEGRYVEMVKKYIQPHKQEAYHNIGKLPYQDELQPESIYDLYQRFTHNEGVGPLPEHNAQKVLAMVNHYAMGIGKYNFKDDFNKVLAEEFNTSVILVIKQHIKGVLDLCEGEVNRNQTDTQIKEFNQLKVSALTHMLEVIDDTMDVMH